MVFGGLEEHSGMLWLLSVLVPAHGEACGANTHEQVLPRSIAPHNQSAFLSPGSSSQGL